MKATVAICSHERPKYLAEAIKSIKKNNYKDYELIVADSSKKPIQKNIQKLCTKYIHTPKAKPLCIKRNITIKHSKGEIFILTDDDCEFHKDWIKEMVDPFKNKTITAVSGNTLPAEKFKDSIFERYFSFKKQTAPKIIKKTLKPTNFFKFGHGNNMAFRKNIFKKIGLFDENLDVGTKAGAGGDTDMFYRIYKKNYSIYFNPKAIVYHKHLIKEKDVPKYANRNGIAGFSLLKKYFPDLRFTLFYIAIVTHLLLKVFKTNNPIYKQALKGWLGLR